MNIPENSNNINPEINVLTENKERLDKETENIDNDSFRFYSHEDGAFSFFPDDNLNDLKKGKKNSKLGNKSTDMANTLETILKKLDQLQRDVTQLMKKEASSKEKNNDEILKTLLLNLPNITSIEKNKNDSSKDEDLDTPTADIFKEFISIYNSQNIKRSISINKELEEKVKKLISKHYGITDNDSKIINTALMIALLKIQ